MDAVALDPRTYQGTYKLVGGQPSLDLVNTVSWPGRPREHDWFDPVENVPGWAVAAGILDPAPARRLTHSLGAEKDRSALELGKVRRIRTTVANVLVPYVRGEVPPPSSVKAFNRLLIRASARRGLDEATLAWTFLEPDTLEHILAPAVVNAAEVMTGVDQNRLGYCPSCDWVFHDTTRNGRRTWCDMADCGSRAKARRHYQRQHDPADRR